MRKFLFGVLLLIVVSFGFVGYTNMDANPTIANQNQTESY